MVFREMPILSQERPGEGNALLSIAEENSYAHGNKRGKHPLLVQINGMVFDGLRGKRPGGAASSGDLIIAPRSFLLPAEGGHARRCHRQ
jgi:hypothetical protein